MKNKSQCFKWPQSQHIRQRQLIPDIVPFSSATLWRKVKTGEFPAPHKLSERITAWKVAEVKEWLESKEGAE
ncbi:MAG: AlpA family phage regulatory protein [Nitrosospira sp.]|nr:AlpA family phage regulatory protein [Nitrosospira sp.]